MSSITRSYSIVFGALVLCSLGLSCAPRSARTGSGPAPEAASAAATPEAPAQASKAPAQAQVAAPAAGAPASPPSQPASTQPPPLRAPQPSPYTQPSSVPPTPQGTLTPAEKNAADVERLIMIVSDPQQSREAKMIAARGLRGIGKDAADAAPFLADMLAEDDEEASYSAFAALRSIGPAAIPAITEVLRSTKNSPNHRLRACKALLPFGDAAVPVLLQMLKDEDATSRYLGAEGVARSVKPPQEAMPILLDMLNDRYFEAARAAARALVVLRPGSVPALEEKRKDPNEQVRALADLALERIRFKLEQAEKSKTGAKEAPAEAKKIEAPATAATAAEAFVDVTAERGIAFRHELGAAGEKHLPETIGAGAAWLDYDGDGYLDLYLVQGHRQLATALHRAAPKTEPGNVLLRNAGGKRFEDVTEKAGVGDRGYGMGVAVGDYDNDGRPDLFVTNFGANALYHNEGDGTFRDVTAAAHVGGSGWSTSAAWGDLDGDGLLDLYVARYVGYNQQSVKPCTLPGADKKAVRVYCLSQKFSGTPDLLYKNQGGGRFSEVSSAGPIGKYGGPFDGKSLGVVMTDVDDDGDLDVLVANDMNRNNLWRNQGGFQFVDAALEVGLAYADDGLPHGGKGIARGDVDGDGRIDYYVTNFSQEPDTLFLNRSTFFTDATRAAGLADPTKLPMSFGVRLLDYDLDGDLDLYIANGHILDNASLVEKGSPGYEEAASLYENDGHGLFREIGAASGGWFQRKLVGRGAAEADYDNDGDGDLLITNSGGPAILLENRAGNGKRWIGIDLQIGKAGRPVIGARVELSAVTARWVHEYGADGSYLVSSDPRLRVGLGAADGPVTAKVRWPGMKEPETFGPLEPGRYHVLRRDK